MDAGGLILRRAAVPLTLLLAGLAGCGDGANQLPQGNASKPVAADGSPLSVEALGNMAGITPMNQRVAVIGLLNKRNGLTRDLQMKPGQAFRVGDAIVRLRACEATAPWEGEKEVGAFIQLDVRTPRKEEWRRVFSGWLFRERPERNVVQHPVYDVWVKDCAMKFPGEEEEPLPAASASSAPKAAGSASASPSPSPSAKPGPAASPAGDR